MHEDDDGGGSPASRTWILLVVALLGVVVGAVLWGAVRGEPAVTGPPPTLPDPSTSTLLAPEESQESDAPEGEDSSAAPEALEEPVEPETTTTASTEPPEPGPIQVRQDGTGDFEDLQTAIDQAQAGDIIEVGDGQWSELVVRTTGTVDEWLQITAAVSYTHLTLPTKA